MFNGVDQNRYKNLRVGIPQVKQASRTEKEKAFGCVTGTQGKPLHGPHLANHSLLNATLNHS